MTLGLSKFVGREDEIAHVPGQGIQAIVHCPDANGEFSKIVVVFKSGGSGMYALNGRTFASSVAFFKLKPKTYEFDFWINLYNDDKAGIWDFSTKQEALEGRAPGWVATINIKRTVTEGEIDE